VYHFMVNVLLKTCEKIKKNALNDKYYEEEVYTDNVDWFFIDYINYSYNMYLRSYLYTTKVLIKCRIDVDNFFKLYGFLEI
jgi:hypothetical protein